MSIWTAEIEAKWQARWSDARLFEANRDSRPKFMKAEEDKIWIDHRLNEAIWANGIQHPPMHITVKAVKFEDGLVEVSLPEDATVEE